MPDVPIDDARKPTAPVKGRGAASRVAGRFAVIEAVGSDDGWGSVYDDLADTPNPATRVREEQARTVISRNDSPDIGFSQSLNPYRGCEHGCVYCFARPSHSYLDLSPGLDFETRLFAKTNAAERLRHELAKPGYRPAPIALGINTDAYQPIERRYRVTRQVLEVLAECRHPVSFVTKSALIERDLDVLSDLARDRLVTVYFSVTTLDNRLASRMEPRATAPHRKLKAMRALHDAGVPVGVMVAPVVPMITDSELEQILEAAHDAGARAAGYVLLRLPHELKQVWREWLELHYPERAAHVMSLVRQMRALHEAGVPVGVMVAPVVPMITDSELEHILEAAYDAGARAAGYVLLRLPHELKQVWREWLELHYPERAAHVMSLVRQMRGGKDYDANFGTRMRGQGPFADLIAQRFARAHRRLRYGRLPPLDCSHFVAPRKPSPQGQLF